MRWKTILLLLAVVVVVDLGVVLVPPYVENFKLDSELKAMARHARIEPSDQVIRASIQKEAENLGIIILADYIQVTRDLQTMYIEIAVEYQRPVVFWPLSVETEFHFSNNVVEKL